MKAWMFGLIWLSLGIWLAWRSDRPAGDRAMMVLFWPLFLGGSTPQPAGPLERLRDAMGTPTPLIDELRAALGALQQREARITAALAGLSEHGEGEVARAQSRSRQMLQEARAQVRQQHEAALAAIEETATRLMLARESGNTDEISALLSTLRARMLAVEEVDGAHG